MANTIFMKKKLLVIVPCTNHQKKKKFLTRIVCCSSPITDGLQHIHIKYNKKPGFTSQQTQGKYKTKLWIKN